MLHIMACKRAFCPRSVLIVFARPVQTEFKLPFVGVDSVSGKLERMPEIVVVVVVVCLPNATLLFRLYFVPYLFVILLRLTMQQLCK